MKIKISRAGHLYIERGLKKSKFKTQYCPYTATGNGFAQCGDWCPLFGEPEHGVLKLCKTEISYDKCIDERN